MVREIPFQDRDVPEVFASRVVRVELLSGSVVRFWLAVEEHMPDGMQYILTLRMLIPLEGVMANRELLSEALAGKAVPDAAVGGDLALH